MTKIVVDYNPDHKMAGDRASAACPLAPTRLSCLHPRSRCRWADFWHALPVTGNAGASGGESLVPRVARQGLSASGGRDVVPLEGKLFGSSGEACLRTQNVRRHRSSAAADGGTAGRTTPAADGGTAWRSTAAQRYHNIPVSAQTSRLAKNMRQHPKVPPREFPVLTARAWRDSHRACPATLLSLTVAGDTPRRGW
jgi:hypothetical protein